MPTLNSGISPKNTFTEQRYLVHLVNTARGLGKIAGGHAALILEMCTREDIVVKQLEIFAGHFGHSGRSGCDGNATVAAFFSTSAAASGVTGQRVGHITNVKISDHKARIDNDIEREALYKKLKFSNKSTWAVTPGQANGLFCSVLQDAKTTAMAIAKLFLYAESIDSSRRCFINKKSLKDYTVKKIIDGEERKVNYYEPKASGQTHLTMFLFHCDSLIEACKDRPAEETHQTVRNFLKACNKVSKFVYPNIDKLYLSDVQLDLMPFSITGSTSTFRTADRHATLHDESPVNCAEWCKKKLLEIGIKTNESNKPNFMTKEKCSTRVNP